MPYENSIQIDHPNGIGSVSFSADCCRRRSTAGDFCGEEGRFLSSDEFLQSAFSYEVAERQLPEPFLSLGIEGMRELAPWCCSVQREDNPFNENRGWLDRLFTDPSVRVVIGWGLEPDRFSANLTSYDMSVCGEVMERCGDFRKRNSEN